MSHPDAPVSHRRPTIAAAGSAGRSVPGELSIVAFDDSALAGFAHTRADDGAG